MIFYHITRKSNINSILKNGLRPMIGSNCRKIHDRTEPAIFLSKLDDLGFWIKCFDPEKYDTILQIKIENPRERLRVRKNINKTTNYEYGCFDPISPDEILNIFNIERSNDSIKLTYR